MPSPRRLWRRTGEVLRDGGPRALFWHALALARVRRMTFYVRDLTTDPPPGNVPGVTVRTLTRDDLRAYAQLRSDAAALADAERRMLRADRGVSAWRGDRLIAVYWVASREALVDYLSVSIPLKKGSFYAYDMFTAPEERGRGLHSVLREAAFDLMRREEGRAVIYAVLPENRGGRRLISQHSRELGTVVSIRLGRWRAARSEISDGFLGRPSASGRGRPLAFGRWTLS